MSRERETFYVPVHYRQALAEAREIIASRNWTFSSYICEAIIAHNSANAGGDNHGR